jgi:uncharacterized protein (DUF1778 family)
MSKYKRPEQFPAKPTRTYVSARIDDSAKDVLEKAANKVDKTLSQLAGEILEDYARWLKSQ